MGITNAIFMTLDDSYLPLFKACINSIRSNYPNHPTIYVACKSNDYMLGNFLRSLHNVIPIHYRTKTIGTKTIYQRYRLWDPSDIEDVDNILHLDCDTLVLQPLDELFEGSEFFIVTNYDPHYRIRVFNTEANISHIQSRLDNYHMSYPDRQHDMANAGVFMIPKKYRTEMYFKKLLEIHWEFEQYCQYADQSIISLWCRYFNIPIQTSYRALTYNVQPSNYSISDYHIGEKDRRIIHFSSPKKPGTEEFENWNWVPKDQRTHLLNLYKHYLNYD